MKAKILLITVIVLLVGTGFLWIVYEFSRPKSFPIITIETTLSWSEGPDVELSAGSIGKFNAELDEITNRELPGKRIHYPVVSLGKRWVEVMYLGSEDMPVTLQKTLNAYIEKRLPEIAEEQVSAQKSK